jgi:hypothetical protein
MIVAYFAAHFHFKMQNTSNVSVLQCALPPNDQASASFTFDFNWDNSSTALNNPFPLIGNNSVNDSFLCRPFNCTPQDLKTEIPEPAYDIIDPHPELPNLMLGKGQYLFCCDVLKSLNQSQLWQLLQNFGPLERFYYCGHDALFSYVDPAIHDIVLSQLNEYNDHKAKIILTINKAEEMPNILEPNPI